MLPYTQCHGDQRTSSWRTGSNLKAVSSPAPIRLDRFPASLEKWAANGLVKLTTILVRVPNLYFGSRLGAQYPKNSKIFRSYSHSTATAEFVKATAGFVMSSEASDQLYFSHFSTFRFVLGNIWLFSCVILTNTVEKVRNPSHFFKPIEVTNSAVAVEWL